MKSLYPLMVEIYNFDAHDWEELGRVLLPAKAPSREVEHALASVGVYAPRGGDLLDWGVESGTPRAIIRDQRGLPLARLGFV